MSEDRHFDALAGRFGRNIYGTAKGRIRLAILQEDLAPLLERVPAGQPLRVLDAGCGPGHMALHLARLGHDLTLCDPSAPMLQQARDLFGEQLPDARVRFVAAPVQALAQAVSGPFDLILFHAVLEWLAEPRASLQTLLEFLAPGGHLSLLFYNRHSLTWRNLLRGNFRKAASNDFAGHPGGLTPANPLDPAEVDEWLTAAGLNIVSRSGVRILYDYLTPELRENRSLEDILEMERRYCRQEPFVGMGRYIHLVAGGG